MSQPTPEGGEIDSRLEELDRRLRAVQDELLPEREPRRVRGVEDAPGAPLGPRPAPEPPSALEPPPPPPPPPRPAVGPPPAGVTAVHTKLVSSLHELLGAYESLLDQYPPSDARRPAPEPPEPQTIAAGPFPTIDAVGLFRDALVALPGVETVVVRAYEGQDRAIFDVKLTGPQLPGGSA